MAWKQWREAVPPSAAGLGIIAGMTMVYGVLGRIGANELYWSAKDELPSFLRGASLIVGTLVALVVGIGTFAGDMQPALLAFWRSRPIQPGLWFWPKYFIGASAVVIFLELPLVFVDLVMSGGRPELMIYDGILASAPLLHLLAYSAAVCAICWFRQAIYSGILALAFVLAIALAPIDRPSLDWLSVGMVINRLRTSTPATIDATLLYIYLPFALAMITLTGVVALLARQGIRVDGRFVHWPRWRRRRDSWA